ncbi:MAG: DUF5367 family protein [Bacteroidota bacterium]
MNTIIMKNLSVKDVIISALMVWILTITGFIGLYLTSAITVADTQAYRILSLIIIPAALIGAHFYYRKGLKTNGFILGTSMFVITLILDVLMTVPFLIMLYGGTYAGFFSNPEFWLIRVEYISVVAAYWQLEKAIKVISSRKTI